MTKILLTGGSGSLGRHVLPELKERGYWVRAISRAPKPFIEKYADDAVLADLTAPQSLHGVCADVDMVLNQSHSSGGFGDDLRRRPGIRGSGGGGWRPAHPYSQGDC